MKKKTQNHNGNRNRNKKRTKGIDDSILDLI